MSVFLRAPLRNCQKQKKFGSKSRYKPMFSSASRCAERRLRYRLYIIMSKIMVNGKAVASARACNEASPPPNSRDMPTRPRAMHQKMRWITGVSVFPPAVMVSITSEPLSMEVTKKISTKVMPIMDVSVASGSSCRKTKSVSSALNSLTLSATVTIPWSKY